CCILWQRQSGARRAVRWPLGRGKRAPRGAGGDCRALPPGDQGFARNDSIGGEMTVLIPFAGLSPVPWNDGCGSTVEIAIGPNEAGFDDFAWRVSLATISEDGAFSQFPGVDRTLALVDGHGMTLQIDGEPALISDAEPVIAFDGSSEVQARLNRGPTLDFNVMSRSERCWH